MRCPVCVLKKQRSTLHPGMSTMTCMGVVAGHYDEDGDWVNGYDPNITTTEYRCSNGHAFAESSRMGKVFDTTITNPKDAKVPSDRPGEASLILPSGSSK